MSRSLEADDKESCTWADDEHAWASSCGAYFILNEGGPIENGMVFCFKCGKTLIESPYEADE